MTICSTPGCGWLSAYGTRFCLEHLEPTGSTRSDDGHASRYYGARPIGADPIVAIPATTSARDYAKPAEITHATAEPALAAIDRVQAWLVRVFESLFR